MTDQPDDGAQVDEAFDPAMRAIAGRAEAALRILEVSIGYRAKAIDGGFPAPTADHMALTLWAQLMSEDAASRVTAGP